MTKSIELPPAIIQSLGLSAKEIYETAITLLKRFSVDGTILDYGSGQGRLLSALADLGFKDLCGADLMPRPKNLSSEFKWVEADLNKSLPSENETFQTILAIEVIEHLENPRAMVRDLCRLLKKDGQLIMSTPNNGSIRSILALILRGHFISFLERDYPAHITALTQLDIQRILQEAGFSEIEFHFTKKGLIPGLKGLTWQKLSFGFLQGKLFSDNIFVTAKKKV